MSFFLLAFLPPEIRFDAAVLQEFKVTDGCPFIGKPWLKETAKMIQQQLPEMDVNTDGARKSPIALVSLWQDTSAEGADEDVKSGECS